MAMLRGRAPRRVGSSFYAKQKFMKRSISAKQKRRGRPATGITPMIGIRLARDKRRAVETWAKTQLDKPSLSEAVRRLVELGLASAHRSVARIKKAMEASEMAGGDSDPPSARRARPRRPPQ